MRAFVNNVVFKLKRICAGKFSQKIGLYQGLKYIDDVRKSKGTYKLIRLYNNQMINEQTLSNLTYKDLADIKNIDIKLFKNISNEIYTCNIESLKRKSKIKVAFLTYSHSIWSCDKLYQLFEQDNRFEPVVIVCGFSQFSPTVIREMYETTLDYFKKNRYNAIGLYDKGKKSTNWVDAENPDIIFFLDPYPAMHPENFNIQYVQLNKLNIYIPYGIYTIPDNTKHDLLTPQLSWKYFCETDLIRQIRGKHSILGNDNMVYCGYTKMDCFYDKEQLDSEIIWKISGNIKNKNDVLKIIYAPHHSIKVPSSNSSSKFSTFDENYMTIYEYAKSHPDTTSWIIKPHPLLKNRTVEVGLFNSEDEFEEYMKKWDRLPNAKAVREGTYIDIFKTSDGMILDSVSFLSEYQYVGKPLLLLTRPTQEYNEFGMKLKEVLYTSSGMDMPEIIKFIEEVLIKKNDYMLPARKQFFNAYLNYVDSNGGKLASEYIYDYLKETF